MKKLTTVAALLLFSLFSLNAFAQLQPVPANKNDLCKKWKIDIEAFMNDLPDEMKTMMEMLPPDQKAMMEESFKKMEVIWVEFYPDGTMKSSDPDGLETGKWELSDDKKLITTSMDGKDESTTLQILAISATTLKLKEPGKPQEPAITFKPF